MSLDVSVYRRIHLVRAGEQEDDLDEALGTGIEYLYANRHFPDHAEGIADGYYRVERPAEDVDLNLRYSYYNFWRKELCLLCTGEDIARVWDGTIVPAAFLALLDFADNEGFVGPARCRALAADFAAWSARAEKHAADLASREGEEAGRAWLDVYRRWARAFATAAPDGVVHFH